MYEFWEFFYNTILQQSNNKFEKKKQFALLWAFLHAVQKIEICNFSM